MFIHRVNDIDSNRTVKFTRHLVEKDARDLLASRSSLFLQSHVKSIDESEKAIGTVYDTHRHTHTHTFSVSVSDSFMFVDTSLVFLSKFGRVCPVTWKEEGLSVACPVDYTARFASGVEVQEWVAVHCRHYVYFVRGRLRALRFRRFIRDFIAHRAPAPASPPRVAVIGPPKV